MTCGGTARTNRGAGAAARTASPINGRTKLTATNILLIITFLLFLSVSVCQAKVTKKSGKDLQSESQQGDPTSTKPPTILTKKLRYPATKVKTSHHHQRAIIAIEIVDPNDNSTKKRNGKRTIESSLGYGYQPSNYFPVNHKPPRYEVYKYSQEDIPPYHGPGNLFTGESSHLEIQKSIRYDLGSTKPELVPHHTKTLANYRQGHQSAHLNQYYTPGTILYSSLDQHGNVGGLSQRVPSHPANHHAGAMVPVIILRVFTNQLARPGTLHPNLPQSHPYAGLNDIDLQSLLNRYVGQVSGYQPQPQTYYQPQQQQQQHYYQSHLQTEENYPDDLHTKVIYRSSTGKYPEMVHSPGLTHYRTKPKEIRVHVPEDAFSSIQVQEHDVHHQAAPQEDENQDQGGGYYYYPPQQDSQQGQGHPEYYQHQVEEEPSQQQYQETLESIDHSTHHADQPQQQQKFQYVSQQEYDRQHQQQQQQEEEGPQQQQYEDTAAAHDAGADDPEKVYNYHAHGQLGTNKREGKKKRKANSRVRQSSRPLVLAPKHIEEDEAERERE